MLRRGISRLGAPGVLAIIALVVALSGGAYAASTLTGKEKKEVKKIAQEEAKKLATAGPQGPAGSAGGAGAKGDPGAPGAPGAPGKDGVSVTTSAASLAECPSGGVKLSSASGTTKVCNGTTGFTEFLPSEKTETGTWSYGVVPEGGGSAKFPISFPIPLEPGTQVTFNHIGLVETSPGSEEFELGPPTANCPGSAEAPEAAPGNLCLYASLGTGTNTSIGVLDPISGEGGKVGAVGAVVTFFGVEENTQGRGDWAVTAP